MEVLNRDQLEKEFRQRFASLGEQHKRLAMALMGGNADPRKLPDSFWQQVEQDRQTALFLLLVSTFGQSAYEHRLRAAKIHPGDVESLRQQAVQIARNSKSFGPEAAALAVAQQVGGHGGKRSADLLKGLVRSPGSPAARVLDKLVSGGDGLGPLIPGPTPSGLILPAALMADTGLSAAARQFATPKAKAVGQGMVNTDLKRLAGKSGEQAINALDNAFGPNRAGPVITNEFTRAQTGGGEWIIRRLNLENPDDIWTLHPELSMTGPCQVCEPLGGTPRRYWSRIFPGGPPDPHPTCCCTIEYASALAN